MLLKRAREAAHAAASTAVRFDLRGQRVAVIDDYRSISDAAEQIGDAADITVAFEYVHDTPSRARMGVHLRSRGTVNVREIAKRYDGGGHKQAAGFSVAVNPNDEGVSPYEAVYDLLDKALEAGV
jgi:nanoRNase/pAp phosphatase (c-di-AMP/oligoRNAs hydrolase)